MEREATPKPMITSDQAAVLLEVDQETLSRVLGRSLRSVEEELSLSELLTAAIQLRNVPLEEVAGGVLEMLSPGSPEYEQAEAGIDKFLRELPLRKASDPDQFLAEMREVLPADRYRQAERIYVNACRRVSD